ncbi:MAG: hypothetical protein WBP81_35490 [Solirubrobacteraceae bacterium]
MHRHVRLAGVCFGALASNVWWATGRATHDFVVYVFAATVGTLVCALFGDRFTHRRQRALAGRPDRSPPPRP